MHKCHSVVGGGSTPGASLPSYGIRVMVADPASFAARLRVGTPSVFGRVEDDAVLLDLRTVAPTEEPHLARALLYALEGDDLVED